MLTLAHALFALALAVLAALSIRLWRRSPGLATFTLALPIALLVWDNGVVALGSLVGEGGLLRALSWPRFLGHALLTPIWILLGFEWLGGGRGEEGKGRSLRVAAFVLYALMALYGLVKSVLLLEMSLVVQGDLLYYTNAGPFKGPPLPAIVMVLVVIAAGADLLRRRSWPWALVGGLVMFAAAAVPTRIVGFWVSNAGEVLISAALVATQAQLLGDNRGAPAKAARGKGHA